MIVPTHGRPERLRGVLDSLAGQALPAERFEVIVVDDGSPVHARPDGALAHGNVRLLRQSQAGPAAARNRGAREARAPLLLFIDDDCVAAPGWAGAFVAAHRRAPAALLGGATVTGYPEAACARVAESLLGFLEAEAMAGGGALDFVASNNIACSRERFVSSGGFDARYPLAAGEDRAFCRDWLADGGVIERVADAHVVHLHALDVARFWRQQRNYGRGAARFHADAAGAGALPNPVGFYARLLLHPLRRRDWPVRRRWSSLPAVALSQLAVATGATAERRAMRRPAEP